MRYELLGASALAFGVVTGFGLSAAHAQQAGTAPPATGSGTSRGTVEDVIVTASRRAERLSHVGVSVTAIGAAELRRQDIKAPSDLTKLVPSLHVTETFGGNPFYTLRGVGFNTRNLSATSPVGVYLDEAAIPYTYMAQGLIFDLDRVEVLKGPQGTLYGRATTGGLVNYVSAKPTHDLHAGGTLEFGNYGTVDASGFVSGPVSDMLRLRIAADTENRFDGWQKSITSGESLGVLHQDELRVSADIGNDGPFHMNIEGSYWHKQGDSQAPQAIYYVFGDTPFANPLARQSIITNPNSDTEADFLSPNRQPEANIGILHPPPTVDADFGSLIVNSSYEINDNLKIVALTDFDELSHNDVDDAAGLQTESIYQDNIGYINSFSQELRLLGQFGRLNWSIGGYFAQDRSGESEVGYNAENGQIAELRYLASIIPQTTYSQAQLANSFGNYDARGGTETTVAATFANGEYKFNDLVKIVGGIRYTEDSNTFNGCTYDYQGGNVPLINVVYPVLLGHALAAPLTPGHCYTLNANDTAFVSTINEGQSQTNVSWKSVLDITPTKDSLLYASISRGYKAGGYPILAGSNVEQFAPVGQEKLDAYEVGSKLGLFDHRVQLNVSSFYYDYYNKQVFGRVADIVFGTLSRIRNVPYSRELGVEGDVTWQINRALSTVLAGDYLSSHIGSFQDYTALGKPANFDGQPFEYTPKFQGNASIIYDSPITDSLRLNASASADYQDVAHADFTGDPLFKIKARTLVDATLGIAPTHGRWTATLYVKNLFDTYYWTASDFAIDTVFRYAGMPRQFGVRFGYRF